MSNGQTFENRAEKRRFSFTHREEAVILGPAENGRFPVTFPANRPQRPQWDSVTMENQGFVYFIRAGNASTIKIGFAADVEKRLKRLQTAHHSKLHLIACMPGTFADEYRLHQRFKHLRIRGEWFRLEDDLRHWINQQAVTNDNFEQLVALYSHHTFARRSIGDDQVRQALEASDQGAAHSVRWLFTA